MFSVIIRAFRPWEENSDTREESKIFGPHRTGENLIGLFPVAVLLKLNLTGLLDEVANMAAAGSEEVGTTAAGDIVTVASVASLDRLCSGKFPES